MSQKCKTRILFVCLGNICRSPTAEGVFTKMVEQKGLLDHFEIDSAGTANYHVGEPPDPRSQSHAKKRGYDLSGLRARHFLASDFDRFDYIVVMDDANLRDVRNLARTDQDLKKISKLNDTQIPDPYREGPEGFEQVLDLIEDCCASLLRRLAPGTKKLDHV